MTISPDLLIGGSSRPGAARAFLHATNPATGAPLEPAFSLAAVQDVSDAAQLAWNAFDEYRSTTPEQRARLLESIANNIDALGDELVERTMAETGLPEGRIRGERTRTTGQLRLFASVLREGGHQGVRIDPKRAPGEGAGRPDIRQRQIALGPVAVFGPSNFPLAFSVAGGDSASALAAGCPVIVKAHNGHLGTSALVGRAVTDAVVESGLPGGVFSLLYGPGAETGQALVTDSRIKAVGFTGSESGGRALMRAAAARVEPIPVYAEMSSINPVFMLPAALAAGGDVLALEFVASLTLGSGQYCTNPGLIFVPEGAAGEDFIAAAGTAIAAALGQTMLTAGTCTAYRTDVAAIKALAGVDLVAEGTAGGGENAPAPALFRATAEAFASSELLQDEVFGSASLVVTYRSISELVMIAERLQGQLTATVQYSADDADDARALLPTLERRAGRVLFNGWPTGVEVNHAMVHGGPFPASSDSRTTSVGSLAIYRFQRPVSYQNVPDELLPAAIQDGNPWGLPRLIDGVPEVK